MKEHGNTLAFVLPEFFKVLLRTFCLWVTYRTEKSQLSTASAKLGALVFKQLQVKRRLHFRSVNSQAI